MTQEFHGDGCAHYDPSGIGRCVDCGALTLGFDVSAALITAQNIARRPFAFHPSPELADQLSQLRAALEARP